MRESTFLTLLPRLVRLGGCRTTSEVEPSPRSKGRVASPSVVDVDIPGKPIESSDVLDQVVELLAEDRLNASSYQSTFFLLSPSSSGDWWPSEIELFRELELQE